jgi:hypothetical protein
MPALSAAPRPLPEKRRHRRVPEARKGQEYKSLQTNVNDADESKIARHRINTPLPIKSPYRGFYANNSSCPPSFTSIRKSSVESPVLSELASRYVLCSIILNLATRSINSLSNFPRSRSHRPKPCLMKLGIRSVDLRNLLERSFPFHLRHNRSSYLHAFVPSRLPPNSPQSRPHDRVRANQHPQD